MGVLEQLALGDASPVVFDVVRVPTPLVGSDWSTIVPGNQVWEILAVTEQLTTSAVVANRRPSVLLDDQTTSLSRVVSFIPAAASQNTQYSFVAGAAAGGGVAGGAVTDALPLGWIAPAGYRLRNITLGLDVGDQWSGIAVWIRRINYGVSDWAVARQVAESVFDDPVPLLG